MNLEFISNYINNKLNQNENIIIITFYDLRVKNNLSIEDTQTMLELIKTRLENLEYETYKTGDTYTYKGNIKKVEQNELFVAIKK